jgi:phosphoglycerate dehydrogenase-like enzyme
MRAVVLDDYQRCASRFASWDDLEMDVEFVHDHLRGDELVARLADASVVVAMRERTPFDAALLARLPALRLLVTTGARNASIDLEAARERDLVVCGTRSLTTPTVELTWALILALMRQTTLEDQSLRSGGWQSTVGADLAGATLGLVGLGRLGKAVARIGLAFDMRVLAWSQNLDHAAAQELGVEPTAKEELFDRADLVSVHLVLSDRTRGIVGDPELRSMKPTAFLVNTSRGPVVDTPALVAALKESRIAGAGIDVYDEEPLPEDHPLRSTPRTVLTPHLGYVTEANYRLFYGDAVEDIRAWAGGSPIRVLGP